MLKKVTIIALSIFLLFDLVSGYILFFTDLIPLSNIRKSFGKIVITNEIPGYQLQILDEIKFGKFLDEIQFWKSGIYTSITKKLPNTNNLETAVPTRLEIILTPVEMPFAKLRLPKDPFPFQAYDWNYKKDQKLSQAYLFYSSKVQTELSTDPDIHKKRVTFDVLKLICLGSAYGEYYKNNDKCDQIAKKYSDDQAFIRLLRVNNVRSLIKKNFIVKPAYAGCNGTYNCGDWYYPCSVSGGTCSMQCSNCCGPGNLGDCGSRQCDGTQGDIACGFTNQQDCEFNHCSAFECGSGCLWTPDAPTSTPAAPAPTTPPGQPTNTPPPAHCSTNWCTNLAQCIASDGHDTGEGGCTVPGDICCDADDGPPDDCPPNYDCVPLLTNCNGVSFCDSGNGKCCPHVNPPGCTGDNRCVDGDCNSKGYFNCCWGGTCNTCSDDACSSGHCCGDKICQGLLWNEDNYGAMDWPLDDNQVFTGGTTVTGIDGWAYICKSYTVTDPGTTVAWLICDDKAGKVNCTGAGMNPSRYFRPELVHDCRNDNYPSDNNTAGARTNWTVPTNISGTKWLVMKIKAGNISDNGDCKQVIAHKITIIQPTPTPTPADACGNITDCNSGQPLPGATVLVGNDTWGFQQKSAVTDANGNWSIPQYLRKDDLYAVVVNNVPANYIGPASTTVSGWNWDYCVNPNVGTLPWADIPLGSSTYSCQMGQSGVDCAGPDNTGQACRCNFCINPTINCDIQVNTTGTPNIIPVTPTPGDPRTYDVDIGKIYTGGGSGAINVTATKKGQPLNNADIQLLRSSTTNQCWYSHPAWPACQKETAINPTSLINVSNLASSFNTMNAANVPPGSYYLMCKASETGKPQNNCSGNPFITSWPTSDGMYWGGPDSAIKINVKASATLTATLYVDGNGNGDGTDSPQDHPYTQSDDDTDISLSLSSYILHIGEWGSLPFTNPGTLPLNNGTYNLLMNRVSGPFQISGYRIGGVGAWTPLSSPSSYYNLPNVTIPLGPSQIELAITPYNPGWFQVNDGDIHANGSSSGTSINDPIANGAVLPQMLTGEGVVSALEGIMVNSVNLSASIGGSAPYTASPYTAIDNSIIPSYDSLKSAVKATDIDCSTPSALWPNADGNYNCCDSTDCSANITLNAISQKHQRKLVFFFNGDLTINTDINKNTSSCTGLSCGLILIVKNNLKIKPTVTNIDATIFYGGEFDDLDSYINGNIKQLVINGSLLGTGASKAFKYNSGLNGLRRIVTNNPTLPGEVINYDPANLVILAKIFGQPELLWQEAE